MVLMAVGPLVAWGTVAGAEREGLTATGFGLFRLHSLYKSRKASPRWRMSASRSTDKALQRVREAFDEVAEEAEELKSTDYETRSDSGLPSVRPRL